jgi:predicted transcriptional regulator
MTRVSEVYKLLKELRCATAMEIAARLGLSRKAVQTYLSRLVARDLVEKRVLGRRAVMYCAKEGSGGDGRNGVSPSTRRAGLHAETRERLARVAELLQREGCISVGTLMRMLNVAHTKAYYMLRVLLLLRQGAKVLIGNTAVLCRDREAAEEAVSRLREAVHRVIVESGMKYAAASKVLQAALRDRDAYELLNRFVPLGRNMKRFPPIVLAFINDILQSLYGESTRYSNRRIYAVTPQPRSDCTFSIIDSADTHVVNVSLPDDLVAALQNADVNEVVLQAIEQLLARYRP